VQKPERLPEITSETTEITKKQQNQQVAVQVTTKMGHKSSPWLTHCWEVLCPKSPFSLDEPDSGLTPWGFWCLRGLVLV
jgi:hypothetical protein